MEYVSAYEILSVLRVAYFTAGATGAGHIVRGFAIFRALCRRGFAGEYTVIAPRARDCFPPAIVPICNYESTAEVMTSLRSLRPDLLLVDMFWDKLAAMLPLPGCEAWLLLRSCPMNWFERSPCLPAYRRVLGLEPFPFPSRRVETIDPVVICNPEDCASSGTLRTKLGISCGAALSVVLHCGTTAEMDSLAQMAPPHSVLLSLRDQNALFPAARWLNDCDQIVAAGGYNTFWESKWLGYHNRMRFQAFSRTYDDQRWRTISCLDYEMSRNGADVLAAMIM